MILLIDKIKWDHKFNFINNLQYMTEQIVRKRIQSARPFGEKQRPLSSRPHHFEQKNQFIQRVYNNVVGLTQRPSSGRTKFKINSLNSSKNNKFHDTINDKQVLIQQNTLLKKKLNMMQMQISHLNGKMVVNRNKNSKVKKILDVEFENETLWNGKNSYLVAGVKNQYEKLKAQFQQKCQQLDSIKQKLAYCRFQQLQKAYRKLQAYSQQLFQKNLSLQQKINISLGTSFASGSASQRNHKIAQFMIDELNQKLAIQQEKLQKKKSIISKHLQTIQTKNTREKFLQRLILQKDNAIHSLHIKNKKLQKQRENYIEQIKSLNERLSQIKRQSEQKISSIVDSQQKRLNKERDIYSKLIEQRNTTIAKLQKQVAYLTTLMSYWKPLDEEKKRNESPIRQINREQVDHKKIEEEKIKKSVVLGESLGILGRAFSQKVSEANIIAMQKAEVKQEDKSRQQKRADVKRSEQAKKVRPVRETQVQQIGELIRYRLIALRIPIDQVKGLFSKQIHQPTTEQNINDLWQAEYITMKQTNQILLKSPFHVTQAQALLFSRYLIQDVENDHIYCAWDNENKREVVKSILKNTIGDYQLVESVEEIESQTAIELEKYKSRISTVLHQLFKQGLISKKKLVDIFVGSGFQLKQSVMDYIIGKLALQSQSLDRLNFLLMF